MTKRIYGYVRVSTQEQNNARQLDAMRSFGVPEKNIVAEHISGKDFERPQYRQLIKKLCPGDVLVVKSIDRLGRNYTEILEQWAMITKEKRVAIVVLDMPLLDTQQGRDLTGTLIADIILQLLSYVAQTERENIRQRQAEGIAAGKARGGEVGPRQRQAEGIAAAKARGVQFGPPAKVLPEGFEDLRQAWRGRRMTLREAAQACGIPKSTFYDAVIRMEKEKKLSK